MFLDRDHNAVFSGLMDISSMVFQSTEVKDENDENIVVVKKEEVEKNEIDECEKNDLNENATAESDVKHEMKADVKVEIDTNKDMKCEEVDDVINGRKRRRSVEGDSESESEGNDEEVN